MVYCVHSHIPSYHELVFTAKVLDAIYPATHDILFD